MAQPFPGRGPGAGPALQPNGRLSTRPTISPAGFSINGTPYSPACNNGGRHFSRTFKPGPKTIPGALVSVNPDGTREVNGDGRRRKLYRTSTAGGRGGLIDAHHGGRGGTKPVNPRRRGTLLSGGQGQFGMRPPYFNKPARRFPNKGFPRPLSSTVYILTTLWLGGNLGGPRFVMIPHLVGRPEKHTLFFQQPGITYRPTGFRKPASVNI